MLDYTAGTATGMRSSPPRTGFTAPRMGLKGSSGPLYPLAVTAGAPERAANTSTSACRGARSCWRVRRPTRCRVGAGRPKQAARDVRRDVRVVGVGPSTVPGGPTDGVAHAPLCAPRTATPRVRLGRRPRRRLDSYIRSPSPSPVEHSFRHRSQLRPGGLSLSLIARVRISGRRAPASVSSLLISGDLFCDGGNIRRRDYSAGAECQVFRSRPRSGESSSTPPSVESWIEYENGGIGARRLVR